MTQQDLRGTDTIKDSTRKLARMARDAKEPTKRDQDFKNRAHDTINRNLDELQRRGAL